MTLPDRTRALIGLFVLCGGGVGLFTVHVVHALQPDETLRTGFYGIWLPMALSLGVLFGGVWLWRRVDAGAHLLRVAAWGVLGATILALGAVLTVLYQRAEGVQMSHASFVVVNAATGGAVAGVVVGVYDCRQQAAWEQEARARAEVDQLNRQLSVLNRVLRHDLRNRAAVIRSRADLLANGRENLETHVEVIRQQVDRLVELGYRMKNLNSALRVDDPRDHVVDLPAVVRSKLHSRQDSSETAEIQVSLPESQPVVAHPLVDEAIDHVVENAIEHTDEPTPRIEIDHSYCRVDGSKHLELTIADNGPGIPESEVRVLERGFETQLEHLSGLGLWFVHWVVTESGGDVWIETNEPTGTVVGLRFECVQPTE